MNKKDRCERDICSKFIRPAVKRAGWDGMMQIREEVNFTKGRRFLMPTTKIIH
jgi:type I restriction enzyme, R subunit